MIKIGVFDSGEGGLSVLKEITRLLPEAEYVYYSDNAHCPYGEKSPEYIQDRARAITERLLKEGADVIVVACNTATAAAISVLRSEYSDASSQEVRDKVRELTGGRHDHICFIGMEPAVKPAALGTRTGVVGVLATAGTLKGSKYLKTKESVDDQVNVCTHYPFLLPVLQKVAGPDIRFIDPAPAVARQLVHVLERDGMLSAGDASSALARNASAVPSSPHVKLLSSGNPEPLHHLYGTIFTNS